MLCIIARCKPLCKLPHPNRAHRRPAPCANALLPDVRHVACPPTSRADRAAARGEDDASPIVAANAESEQRPQPGSPKGMARRCAPVGTALKWLLKILYVPLNAPLSRPEPGCKRSPARPQPAAGPGRMPLPWRLSCRHHRSTGRSYPVRIEDAARQTRREHFDPAP